MRVSLSARTGARWCAAAIGATLSLAGACGTGDHPPPLGQNGGTTGTGGDDGFDAGMHDGPPPLDAPGYCGNQIHQTVFDTPTLYFVLDASGSMNEAEGNLSRYDAVRVQVVDLVRKLGPRIRVGAAVFPQGVTDEDQCHVGAEVFPVSPGDPVSSEDGPTTTQLRLSTLVGTPVGGTPTAATLELLRPGLLGLPGRTIVLLATDGGPNCNPAASCSVDECMANIDGQCESSQNCCAPGQLYGPTFCVDRPAAVSAVAELADAGIDVYVIGIAGSETYADVLSEMALAGGAPQPEAPFYHPVGEVAALGAVFGSIASVAISCEFTLVNLPPEEGKTNVYLDQVVLPLDPIHGWRWKSEAVIELMGESCARLKTGAVAEVQIVSGCPTEVPK